MPGWKARPAKKVSVIALEAVHARAQRRAEMPYLFPGLIWQDAFMSSIRREMTMLRMRRTEARA